MSPSLNSSFLYYNLSANEFESGSTYSTEQRAVIQNLIADCAEERIRLKFDPLNPSAFMQADAELQGKIGILQYLLSLESTLSTEVN